MAESQRIDKWLWHARMLKTRTAAATLVSSGKVRVNGDRVSKASHAVAPEDVLTFALNRRIRILKILAIAQRRGPYEEARLLYEDLSPEAPATDAGEPAGDDQHPSRPRGSGRPTKKQRRELDQWRAMDE